MCKKVPEDFSTQVYANIAVNQIAYGVGDKKIAIIRDADKGEAYLCKADGEVVFSAPISAPKYDVTNRVYVRHFDFSSVEKEGEYVIKIKEGVSYPFAISKKPLQDVTKAMIKALYFQRCGMALEEKYAGPYTHGACHNLPAYLLTDKSVVIDDVSGGWHDAGDYGKYITPANQTVFNMMCAYEFFPDGCDFSLNIPESGNGVPDILNECRYELEWMLKMQNKEGGVYHKVTTETFAGNDMPDVDTEKWEIQALSPVAIPATAGFAAALSQASIVYAPFDKAFADKCLQAAIRAFDYAYANYPDHKEFQNVPPCNTGGYGDGCCLDEVYWGAASLFRATGDKKYEEIFREFFDMKFSKSAFGAYNQGGHGSFIYCLCENADYELKSRVLDTIIKDADKGLVIYERNAYRLCLNDGANTHENEYYWGSNAVLTNKLANMISVAYLTKTDKYDECIRESIHYIMGRNYISRCYVTGFGTNSVKNPHHRPSMFDGVDECVPGLVAGGPNDRQWQRPSLIKGVRQTEGIDWDNMPAAGCFVDWEWNWTTNEVTIYWNSSCFYVTSYLNSKNK